ncbi:MAG: sugar phosphate isomerase/epimerase [Kiritimatiellaeota bacterium]|nr:sugar phosphate isomerase/epimerase [Kiritimatiellota bacterium]
MKLGIVTYNIAKDWDLPTIIEVCETVGLAGVELRTTHAHGVEVSLSGAERAAVRRKFEESDVELVGLGSAFEYHSPDPEELRRNLEGTREYIRLAADVGAGGVKVRPNSLPDSVPVEETLEQIGRALREIGAFGAEHGIEVRLEVHGRGTSLPEHICTILDVADHPNVKACWNSNRTDIGEDGSIAANFALLGDRIGLVHINELWSDYPWREEFALLNGIGYAGFTLAEIPGMPDRDAAVRLLRYYAVCWSELQR